LGWVGWEGRGAGMDDDFDPEAIGDDEFADLGLDLSKKKKKKVVKVDKLGNTIEEEGDEGGDDDDAAALAENDPDLDLEELSGMKKKKKKKSKMLLENLEDEVAKEAQVQQITLHASLAGQSIDANAPWLGSDRDYSYDDLLTRFYAHLRQLNPDLAGDKKRTKLAPPQVAREGTKKTVFANFMQLAESMHRDHSHLLAFILAELGTFGSTDGNDRLILKGRFQPKGIETVLRRYMNEYVVCSACKSTDTQLTKDARLSFLNCKNCGASRSVAAMTAGFQAQVGKRRAMRAAAG